MYGALECGSRNHLRAFTGQLAGLGVTYTPKYLDATTYQAILASAHERCGQQF